MIAGIKAQLGGEKGHALVATIVIFIVLGPPIGWLMIAVCLAGLFVSGIGTYHSVSQALINFFGAVGAGFLLSYFLGVVPALIAGLAVGFGQVMVRSFGFFHIVVTGIAVGLLVVWKPALMLLSAKEIEGLHSSLPRMGTAVALCLIATIACWCIARWWQTRFLRQ